MRHLRLLDFALFLLLQLSKVYRVRCRCSLHPLGYPVLSISLLFISSSFRALCSSFLAQAQSFASSTVVMQFSEGSRRSDGEGRKMSLCYRPGAPFVDTCRLINRRQSNASRYVTLLRSFPGAGVRREVCSLFNNIPH